SFVLFTLSSLERFVAPGITFRIFPFTLEPSIERLPFFDFKYSLQPIRTPSLVRRFAGQERCMTEVKPRLLADGIWPRRDSAEYQRSMMPVMPVGHATTGQARILKARRDFHHLDEHPAHSLWLER